jgi:hypothetical protein
MTITTAGATSQQSAERLAFTSSPCGQRIDADDHARQAADVQLKLAKQATDAAGHEVTEDKAAWCKRELASCHQCCVGLVVTPLS